MKSSYKFFANTACEFYPCHKNIESLNCLFCYCPFYSYEKCPGKPEYIMIDDKKTKSCSNCVFPHKAENYEVIIKLLSEKVEWEIISFIL